MIKKKNIPRPVGVPMVIKSLAYRSKPSRSSICPSFKSCARSRARFFFSSRRRHTMWNCDWSSDVCSSDLGLGLTALFGFLHYVTGGPNEVEETDEEQAKKTIDEIGRASCRERV